MKIYYTPHRGTLKDALKEQHVFQSLEDMLEFIVADREFFRAVAKEDIYLRYYGFDSRIPAEMFVVGFGKFGFENHIHKYGHPGIFGWVHFKATQSDVNADETISTLLKLLRNWKRVSDIDLKFLNEKGND